jgi:predicted  nucleic acid-binding Zn-ribbon protein
MGERMIGSIEKERICLKCGLTYDDPNMPACCSGSGCPNCGSSSWERPKDKVLSDPPPLDDRLPGSTADYLNEGDWDR